MKYSILVNTCDKFDDCWDPFFKLLTIYWPDCKEKIYLNTEYKDYSFGDLDITAVKGSFEHNIPKGKYPTWSQCLIWALEKIETPIILYMQEDYFLKDKVKSDIIDRYVEIMEKDSMLKCIYISNPSVWHTEPSEYENLHYVAVNQNYRVSCQAALWKKDELLALLRARENAWYFEIYGSQRSGVLAHKYLGVPRSYVYNGQFEILPYIYTGIVKGQWLREVVPLFTNHQIEIDFSLRGFVGDSVPKLKLFPRVMKYLHLKWFGCLNYFSMMKLKLKI